MHRKNYALQLTAVSLFLLKFLNSHHSLIGSFGLKKDSSFPVVELYLISAHETLSCLLSFLCVSWETAIRAEEHDVTDQSLSLQFRYVKVNR